MKGSKKQPSPISSLLNLPDEVIRVIVKSLHPWEKENFMTTCRSAFLHTMLASDQITLKIYKPTEFSGIRKLLDALPSHARPRIVCTVWETDIVPVYFAPLPALAMFMGIVPNKYLTQVASSCQWEGITHITIESIWMRCLLPRFMVIACPHLRHLHIKKPFSRERLLDVMYSKVFTGKPADAFPLTVCSSLQELKINVGDESFDLPPAYHSPAELRLSLPNIDTLNFSGSSNASLLQALGAQLTCLKFRIMTPSLQQSIRPCYNLQHLRINELWLPDNAASLRVLHLPTCVLSDYHVRKLLQLPSLKVLRCDGIDNIKQDWSNHACSWQELHLKQLPRFTTLANLDLSNLITMTVDSEHVIEIAVPSHSNPHSRTAVQRAVNNLAHVGEFEIAHTVGGASTEFGRCGTITWKIPERGSSHEQSAADMLAIAAQRVGQVKICYLENLLHRPLVLNAVSDWGHTFIESVCLGKNYEPEQHVWDTLRGFDKLSTIVFWGLDSPRNFDIDFVSDDQEYAHGLLKMSSAVCIAAQQYVVPSNKSLRLDFGADCDEELEEYLAEEGSLFLQAAIHEVLPAGCELVSVELCCATDRQFYTEYGGLYGSHMFWVVEVKPSQTTS